MKKGIMLGVVLILIVVALIVHFYFNSEKSIDFSREECQSQGGFHVQEQYSCPLNSEEIFRGSDSSSNYLCCKSTNPLTEVDVNWDNLELDNCGVVTSCEGGYCPPTLGISFIDPSLSGNFNFISFSVSDFNKEDLLTEGIHYASEDVQGISNSLSSDSYSWLVNETEMEIIFEEIEVQESSFVAKGLIKIKKKIVVAFNNQYYLPKEIPFECINGRIY